MVVYHGNDERVLIVEDKLENFEQSTVFGSLQLVRRIGEDPHREPPQARNAPLGEMPQAVVKLDYSGPGFCGAEGLFATKIGKRNLSTTEIYGT